MFDPVAVNLCTMYSIPPMSSTKISSPFCAKINGDTKINGNMKTVVSGKKKEKPRMTSP